MSRSVRQTSVRAASVYPAVMGTWWNKKCWILNDDIATEVCAEVSPGELKVPEGNYKSPVAIIWAENSNNIWRMNIKLLFWIRFSFPVAGYKPTWMPRRLRSASSLVSLIFFLEQLRYYEKGTESRSMSHRTYSVLLRILFTYAVLLWCWAQQPVIPEDMMSWKDCQLRENEIWNITRKNNSH